MSRVTGDQRVGLAGQGDLEEREIILVQQLRGARACDDPFAVGLELPRDLGNVGRVERKTRTRQHFRIFCQDSLVE